MSDIEKALANLKSPYEISKKKSDISLSEASIEAAVRKIGNREAASSVSPISSLRSVRDCPQHEGASLDLPANEENLAHRKSGLSTSERASDNTGKTPATSDKKIVSAENGESGKSNPFEKKKPESILNLPLDALQKDGYLVPNTPKGRLTEEYRRIKRPLLRNLRQDEFAPNANIVMVTSSVSGEGKTYTAINLAMSFALERNRTVLFVDGDVIKCSAGTVLGVSTETVGLTDVLSGTCPDIGDAIQATNVSSLSFLPAGSENLLANELLSSDGMNDIVDELTGRYSDRIIIIDSPPILQTNEANIICEHAGQVVFVVAEAETPQATVKQALSHIDKDKYVGILINKSNSAGKTYGYGYGYGV